MNLQVEKIVTICPAFSTAEDAFMIEVDNLLGRFVEGAGRSQRYDAGKSEHW